MNFTYVFLSNAQEMKYLTQLI